MSWSQCLELARSRQRRAAAARREERCRVARATADEIRRRAAQRHGAPVQLGDVRVVRAGPLPLRLLRHAAVRLDQKFDSRTGWPSFASAARRLTSSRTTSIELRHAARRGASATFAMRTWVTCFPTVRRRAACGSASTPSRCARRRLPSSGACCDDSVAGDPACAARLHGERSGDLMSAGRRRSAADRRVGRPLDRSRGHLSRYCGRERRLRGHRQGPRRRSDLRRLCGRATASSFAATGPPRH